MGAKAYLESGDRRADATTYESWTAEEHDGAARNRTTLALAGITSLLVALAAFFVAFAPS